MILQLFGTMVIAALIGYGSERIGFTRNGYVPSILICVGGAVVVYVMRLMFGIRLGTPGVDAVLSSMGALVILPTHWRRQR